MEVSYLQKKKVLEAYFNRTAFAAWERLTSELPVSWVRERVREGRNNTKNQNDIVTIDPTTVAVDMRNANMNSSLFPLHEIFGYEISMD